MSGSTLAAFTSHPIQYQAPLFRELANRDELDLTVYFYSKQGVEPKMDEGFQQEVTWDVPLLEGYDYEFIRTDTCLGDPSSFFGFNPALIVRLRRANPDAVWVHGYGSLTDISVILAADFLDIPVVFRGEVMPWTIGRTVKQKVIDHIFNHVSAFASIGTPNRRLYKSFGFDDERIFHAPYTVHNKFFRDQREQLPTVAQLRKENEIPHGRHVILFVGKLIERKRPSLLVNAFCDSTNPGEATLLFVGDGDKRSTLETAAIDRGRSDDIKFMGFVNQTELPRYYELSDVFVLPSVHENWGLVINEAMNFELPVIATSAVGATTDLVTDENGIVVPPDNCDVLAVAIRRFIEADASERAAAGQESLERISDWDIETTADGIENAVMNVQKA